MVPLSDIENSAGRFDFDRVVGQFVSEDEFQSAMVRNQLPSTRVLIGLRARQNYAIGMVRLFGLVGTQMRAHPRGNAERFRTVFVSDIRQLQMSSSLHPHVGPEPSAFTPHYRCASGRDAVALFRRCGVGERVAFSFVESQTHRKIFGADSVWATQWLCQPLRDQRARLCAAILNFATDRVFFRQRLFVGGAIFRLRNEQDRRPIISIIIERIFGEIIEERGEFVKILLSDWIEFVIVTVRASDCQPQESRAVSLGAFALVVYAQLFSERAAFAAADAGPDVRRGHFRIQSLVGQHVSGKLLDDEAVEMLVLVVGVDDVIAIRPDEAEIIDVKAVRVAVTRDVEPVMRAMLSVSWAFEQSINYFFIGVGRIVGHEGFNFLRCWRQTSQVVSYAANQRSFICLRRRTQPFFFQSSQDEVVDRRPHPVLFLYRGKWLRLGSDEGPMLFVDRTLSYPFHQRRDLFWFERLMRFRGRHAVFRISCLDLLNERALADLAGNDRGTALD